MPKRATLLTLLTCLQLPLAVAAEGEVATQEDMRYVPLKPSVVANLNGGPDYIRCDIQLMTTDPERLSDIERHAAALRHEIFLLMPDEDGAVLQTPQGKEGLRQRLRDALRRVLEERTGEPLINELYFTSYYVQ